MSQRAYLMARFERIAKDAKVINFPEGGRIPHEQRKAAKREAAMRDALSRSQSDRMKHTQAAWKQQQTLHHMEAPAAVRRMREAGADIDRMVNDLNRMPPPRRVKTPKARVSRGNRALAATGIAAMAGTGALVAESARRDRQRHKSQLRSTRG